ncbi:MAG TPA: response regulator transcription factor [Candidatus Scatomorpha gallistercoris]|nr:response regulator transcription factor [Candidatus Scatomorpha gallistercoris]
MARILICDDDPDIVAALKIYLTNEDYELYTASTGREALESIRDNNIDLVLMDIMMPEMDGIAATVKLREEFNIPVIFLTAKSEVSDMVLGLNVGADDYVTKPFDPVEVQARVRSHLRRYMRLGGQLKPEPVKDVLSIGGIELNDAEKSVTVDGEGVYLTPIEYNILHLLMRNPNRVFSSGEIYERVWNENALGNESSVAVHIRHLREKIEINPSEPRYLKVVWGQGYKMEARK